MAGKCLPAWVALGANTAAFKANMDVQPPLHPGDRINRAYAEGRLHVLRGGSPVSGNPHGPASNAKTAWNRGAFAEFASPPGGNHNGTEYNSGVPDLPAP